MAKQTNTGNASASQPDDVVGRLRQRAQTLRPELDYTARVMDQGADRIEQLEDALTQITQWCEAYPKTVFLPINRERMRLATRVLRRNGIDMGALHAQWARHLTKGIAAIAKAEGRSNG
jgi:hypothetical protein